MADMGRTFFNGSELERADNDGDYEPGNCKWVTRTQQQRNKRSNRRITIGNKTQTLVEWAEETGLKANTILTRLRRGWPEQRLLEIANA